jgi:glycosyltransferase involved in cell wall biosynthesis
VTVAINAQLLPGSAGGIETNLLGLLEALAALDGGRQVVIGPDGRADWLRPHLGPRQALLPWAVVPPSRLIAPLEERPVPPRLRPRGRSVLERGAAVMRRLGVRVGEATLSEVLSEMGVDVVHCPYQRLLPTTLPMVFEPWDLQHRHHPEFFAPEEIRLRDALYVLGCRRAKLVITASRWTKQDLVRLLAVAPDKIAVIPRGPAVRGRSRLSPEAASRRLASLSLPERFVLYPAKTWPHKNHVRMFEALAHLRDRRGIVVPLVCTSAPVAGSSAIIQGRLEALGLDKQVLFIGYVSQDEMDALFSLAEFLVFPSLFEGLGLPVLEAMHFGLPVVASAVTCLPEIAGDAALYCDPLSVESIADAVERMWRSPAARDESRRRGRARVEAFSWVTAATQFAVCYRRAAGRALSPTETAALEGMTA